MRASVRPRQAGRQQTPAPDWALRAERAAALPARAVAGGAPSVETFAPATGAKVADLPQSGVADLDTAFERARKAQREWAARPIAERTAVFARLHDLIL